MTARVLRKWQLQAWPPGPRFITVDGKTRSAAVFRRDYASQVIVNRAVPQVRRMYPDAQLEITQFRFTGAFWLSEDTRVC